MSITVNLPDSRENILRNCTDALAILAMHEQISMEEFRECITTPLFDLYQMIQEPE